MYIYIYIFEYTFLSFPITSFISLVCNLSHFHILFLKYNVFLSGWILMYTYSSDIYRPASISFLFFFFCIYSPQWLKPFVCLWVRVDYFSTKPSKTAMSHTPLKTMDLFFLISNLDSKSLDQVDCDLLACMPCGNHHGNRLLNQRQTNRAGLLPPHKSELAVSVQQPSHRVYSDRVYGRQLRGEDGSLNIMLSFN